MILTDTGPIVALLDSDDPYHSQCLAASQRLPGEPFLTTWPCFTEAMYLLGLAGGHRYRVSLWDLYRAGNLVLHNPTPGETGRMAQLMAQYHDRPMGLADASLVAAAESLSWRQVFTLDGDFYIYRLNDGTTLEVLS